jgi:quercetin dioxygenase-like cupin family protein
MRRIIVFSLVLASALIVLLLGTLPRQLSAQEATPAAAQPNLTVGQLAPIGAPFEVVPGIDLEILNEGEPANAPGSSLVLYRVTFRGGEVPPHMHPGTTVATVESGTFSWTLLAGTVWVTRPGAAPEEVTGPGTEIVLNPGEGLIYHDDIVHTARAAGDEPAVVLVTALFETGQPFLTLTDEHGTPLPMGTPAT